MHEYGLDDLPERAFLRRSVPESAPKVRAAIRAGLRGRSLDSPLTLPPNVARQAGEAIADQIRSNIDTLRTPPNKPDTIARKGSRNPLLDSQTMRDAVEVRTRPRRPKMRPDGTAGSPKGAAQRGGRARRSMIELLDYLGGLDQSRKGGSPGEPLTVFPWQRRFIRGAFRKGVTTAALSVARANGKTCSNGGDRRRDIGRAVDGPEIRNRARGFELFRASPDRLRALSSLSWATGCGTGGAGRYGTRRSKPGSRTGKPGRGCAVLGSDPRRAHGLAPSLVRRAMSPHSGQGRPGERMVAALRTAAGKQPESRFVALGTRPADADLTGSRSCSPGGADYAQTHAARLGDPPFWKRTWRRANPSLDHLPDLGGRDPGGSCPGTA